MSAGKYHICNPAGSKGSAHSERPSGAAQVAGLCTLEAAVSSGHNRTYHLHTLHPLPNLPFPIFPHHRKCRYDHRNNHHPRHNDHNRNPILPFGISEDFRTDLYPHRPAFCCKAGAVGVGAEAALAEYDLCHTCGHHNTRCRLLVCPHLLQHLNYGLIRRPIHDGCTVTP